MPLRLLKRIIDVDDRELGAVLGSFLYFFCLLSSYYILRPIRDEMGIAGGAKKLPWLFTGTFVAMLAVVPLFSAVVSRAPRRRIVPIVYRFFALNLLAFFAAIHLGAPRAVLAPVFFIWTNVYNFLIVSVFWSTMADLFDSEQGKRLFGFIAAGGSAGALAGPAITGLLVRPLGVTGLFFLSALLLEASVQCVLRLSRRAAAPERAARLDERIGGGLFAGITLIARSRYLLAIAAHAIAIAGTGVFLYVEQAKIVEASSFDPTRRTELFATIDFLVNVVALVVQALITGRILKRIGLAFALGLLPVISGLGFLGIAAAPGLWLIAALQGVRRAVHYAVERPAREVLFTVVGGEARYKAKSFIDTVVVRGGDAASGWLFEGLAALGLGVAGTAIAAAPFCLGWLGLTTFLARRQQEIVSGRAAEAEAAVQGVAVGDAADNH